MTSRSLSLWSAQQRFESLRVELSRRRFQSPGFEPRPEQVDEAFAAKGRSPPTRRRARWPALRWLAGTGGREGEDGG
jgi:hypothetical protein